MQRRWPERPRDEPRAAEVSGEHEYPVPTLAMREAVELFAARARAVDPGFDLTETAQPACQRSARVWTGRSRSSWRRPGQGAAAGGDGGRLERSLELL
jgi:hypothetical protein